MEKKLGKIESVKFGLGGYQSVMFGLSVTLSGQSWGVGDFKGTWDCENIKVSELTKWTEADTEQKTTMNLFVSYQNY